MIISVVSIAGLFLCGFAMLGQGEGGLICLIFTMPQSYALIFTGFEYFVALFNIFLSFD